MGTKFGIRDNLMYFKINVQEVVDAESDSKDSSDSSVFYGSGI